jgi:hypothetical protein
MTSKDEYNVAAAAAADDDDDDDFDGIDYCIHSLLH